MALATKGAHEEDSCHMKAGCQPSPLPTKWAIQRFDYNARFAKASTKRQSIKAPAKSFDMPPPETHKVKIIISVGLVEGVVDMARHKNSELGLVFGLL